MSRRTLTALAGLLLLAGGTLAAQQPARGYTQMILGVGYTTDDPAFAVGFEQKASTSSVAFRALLEYAENHSSSFGNGTSWYSDRKRYGGQLLGIRVFRDSRRVQPYLFGGLGLYYERHVYGRSELAFGDGGVTTGPFTSGVRHDFTPSLVWGTGLNVRLRGVSLFGELRMPMYSTGANAFRLGPQAPLLFGFRF